MFTRQDIQTRFDAMNLRYDINNDGDIIVTMTGKQNYRYWFLIAFEKNICRVFIYTGIQFPEYNFKLLDKINEFNIGYKMYSFCVNADNNNELVMHAEIESNLASDVEYLIQLITVGIYILEDLYPDAQRLIWSN